MGADPLDRPRAGAEPKYLLKEIVPQRAVLTELARGFLLKHQSDPKSARDFAVTFLRERAGAPAAARVIPPQRLLSVRRGVSESLRED